MARDVPRAWIMRRLVLIASLVGSIAGTLTGCLGAGGGGSGGGGSRPAVIPKLSEMPAEPEKRDAILDQSTHTEGPEGNNSKLTRKERKVVTNAAFAAAIIGSMFSKTENTTFGAGTTFDEDTIVAPGAAKPQPMGPQAPGEQAPPAAQLVPWVQLPADPNAPAPAPAQPSPTPAQPK